MRVIGEEAVVDFLAREAMRHGLQLENRFLNTDVGYRWGFYRELVQERKVLWFKFKRRISEEVARVDPWTPVTKIRVYNRTTLPALEEIGRKFDESFGEFDIKAQIIY